MTAPPGGRPRPRRPASARLSPTWERACRTGAGRAPYHVRVTLEEPLPPPLPARRRLIAPFAAAALVLALLVGGGVAAFLVSGASSSDAPPPPGPFEAPPPARPTALFDVREANGASLTLLPANIEGEAITVALAAGAEIEALVPTDSTAIAPGHWLMFLGAADPVRNFVIRRVIALREPGAPQAGGLARSPAGFTGAEVVADPSLRPILWGRVEAVAPGAGAGAVEVILTGPDGPIIVQLLAGVPFAFVEPWDAPIADGDRIATRATAGTSPANAQAVLVAPQGAR